RIDAEFANEFFGHEIDQPLIPILAPKHDIAISGQSDEILAADFHYRDVERAPTQVIDQDLFPLTASLTGLHESLLEAKCNSSGCRLVDDVEHFQAGDVACIHRRLAAD